LGKGLDSAKQAFETKELVYNKTLAQIVSNVDDIVLKHQNTSADISNLTTGLTKVAKVHNKVCGVRCVVLFIDVIFCVSF